MTNERNRVTYESITKNHAAHTYIEMADRSDVRRSRVRNGDRTTHDMHGVVNRSVAKTDLKIDESQRNIRLYLKINTTDSSIMDEYKIFLDRMILCRKAAEKPGLMFGLTINGQDLL